MWRARTPAILLLIAVAVQAAPAVRAQPVPALPMALRDLTPIRPHTAPTAVGTGLLPAPVHQPTRLPTTSTSASTISAPRPSAVSPQSAPPSPVHLPPPTETTAPPAEPIPAGGALRDPFDTLPSPQQNNFPMLPPDPYAEAHQADRPLDAELWAHGGSYLYAPEGDRLNWPEPSSGQHYELHRLPEDWVGPQPITRFAPFLGTGPIRRWPDLDWPGPGGYAWEPRFVAYGGLELSAQSLEENGQRQDGLACQLLVDLDLRLTGTERFHVQLRPVGRQNTGGSFYQFNRPRGYVDNSTGEPQRYWFEGEFDSLCGAFLDEFAVRDLHFVVGKFPLALYNGLLINDEILGVAVNKNNIYWRNLSGLNVQFFHGFNDVDAYDDSDALLFGVHGTADYRRVLIETTYAYVRHDVDRHRDAHYVASSMTWLSGVWSLSGRTFYKIGDKSVGGNGGGDGDGQLFVWEMNHSRKYGKNWTSVDHGLFYLNAFFANDGWTPISGGNLNRLRSSFETNPLVSIAAGRPPADTAGLALGIQLFDHTEDHSLIPEIAWEQPDGVDVFGFGMRFLLKTGPRTYGEVLGVYNWSDDPRFRREGIFLSHNFLF